MVPVVQQHENPGTFCPWDCANTDPSSAMACTRYAPASAKVAVVVALPPTIGTAD